MIYLYIRKIENKKLINNISNSNHEKKSKFVDFITNYRIILLHIGRMR